MTGKRSWALAALLAGLAMLGPFSIDTYLPAFPFIAGDLGAGTLAIQQTITVYMLAYAFMMLWHGALSDALGRRPIVLAGLLVYAFAALGCAIAGNIETLWLFRALQGISAGAGIVVGRAIVRDLLHGPEAQRQMSQVTMVFSVAPAIAPILGGFLVTWFGWRSIFTALLGIAVLLFAWSTLALPETLPRGERQSLHPKALWVNYRRILLHREFGILALMLTCNFCGFFVYVAAAPVFLIEHLGLTAQDFGWLFVPMVVGIMLGAWASGRAAGRITTDRTIRLGFVILFAGAALNLALALALPPSVPWSVLPVMMYCFGSSLIQPSVMLRLLDMFPATRGTAASLQGFVQIGISALVAGALAPFLAQSPAWLACGMLGFTCAALASWKIYRTHVRNRR